MNTNYSTSIPVYPSASIFDQLENQSFLKTEDIHALLGVQKGCNVPMFNWDWSLRKFLPTRTSINFSTTRRDRLNRSEVWAKYGCSMHFFTLEFQKDDLESEFIEDSFHRNVGFVKYGSLIVGIIGFLIIVQHLSSYKHADAPFFITVPIFVLQYLFFTFFRRTTERYFQRILFFSAFLGITLMLTWAVFLVPIVLPDFSRETDSYVIIGDNHQRITVYLASSASILTFLVIILAVFRMRFASFAFIMLYFLIAYEALIYIAACIFGGKSDSTYDRLNVWGDDALYSRSRKYGVCHYTHFPSFQNTSLASVLLLVLSYSLEVLQRKDFIQAQMVLAESKRSDTLLQNILPPLIIKKLKDTGGRATANEHDEVTILFADVVSFTVMSSQISAKQLVTLLNDLFNSFDALAAENGVEKIKTIGDCYMAVAGIPDKNPMHAKAMSRFALRLCQTIRRGTFKNPATNESIEVRVGLHSGRCIAGVLGQKKFAYDVWGDAVNTASRMESHGEAGKVHISEATAELINDDFFVESRGVRQIKGKGEMHTFFLVDERGHAKYASFFVTGNKDIHEQTKALADALETAKGKVPLDEVNAMISDFSAQIVRGRVHESAFRYTRGPTVIRRGDVHSYDSEDPTYSFP